MGIIVSGSEIIQPRLVVIEVPAVAEGVEDTDVGGIGGGGEDIAAAVLDREEFPPSVVAIPGDNIAGLVVQAQHVPHGIEVVVIHFARGRGEGDQLAVGVIIIPHLPQIGRLTHHTAAVEHVAVGGVPHLLSGAIAIFVVCYTGRVDQGSRTTSL